VVYYSCIMAMTFLTLGVLCILVRENDRFTRDERKPYYLACDIVALSALCEWLGIALNGNTDFPAWMLQSVKCADYILTPLAGGLLMLQLRGPHTLLKPTVGILAFNVLFQIVSAFFGWTVAVDSQNTYFHGPLYPLYMAMYIAVIAMVVVEFIVYGQRFRRQNRASVYATLALVVAGIALQELLGDEVRTAYLGLAIGMALLYIRNAEYAQVEKDDEVRELDYRLLMSQITPHFLFNCLSAIREIYREDPDAGDRSITSFSRYLRYNLDSISRDRPIAFADELGHVRRYLELQQLRFGDALVVTYDVGNVDFSLPALTLQPIVENAVTHGSRKVAGRPGHVTVRAEERDDSYVVSVIDDGPGFDADAEPADARSHVGLRSVRERLELVGAELAIDSEPGSGTTVTMTFPKGA